MLNHPLPATRTNNATLPSLWPQRNRFKHASKRIKLALCLLLLLLTFLTPLRPIQPVLAARTRYVPAEYPTIQQAVNSASQGDTIQVSPGLYHEHIVVPETINELKILGNPANPATTIVDGTSNGTVFRLDGNKVTVKGFTVRNAGNGYNAIYSIKDSSTNDYHVISNNIIETSERAISLGLSNGNTVTNNTFIDNANTGINLEDSDDNIISQNTIQQSPYGIKMITSTGNNINNNKISETSYGIHISLTSTGNILSFNNVSGQTAGIFINSDSNTAHHNVLTHSAYGIWCYNCKYAKIYYNSITHGSYGIRIQWSTTVTASYHNISYNKAFQNKYGWGIEAVNSNSNNFTGNWLQENAWGISLASSAFNTLYHNNFINNNVQATTNAANTWDNGYPSGGNYWSDYAGVDFKWGPSQNKTGSDGIGDTPYRITPGQDNYPLMHTYSQHDIAVQSVTPSTNEALQGTTITITVTVRNNANTSASENFQVTTKYNSSIIGTQTVTGLAQGATRILTFNWDTTQVPPGNYIIKAEATTVTDELNTDNNNLSDGTVRINLPLVGDINLDGTVNNEDLILMNQAYGSTPQSPNWNSNSKADLNKDNIVDTKDLQLLGQNYGSSL
jgi:parallel beta-helix repeat protein